MSDDARLAEILIAWKEARERGAYRDPEEVIRGHPDLADALRARFATLAALDEIVAESENLAPSHPERLGGYRVLEEIGSGGMGTVLLAKAGTDTCAVPKGERVALKVLHPHLLSRPGFFKRFLQEAALGRRVDDEHVVRSFEVDADLQGGSQVTYMVMEYVEGRTLRELQRDLGTVPEALLRELARQTASGLAAIHEAGIVHRDLKPENILITDDQRVRIMDLGIAHVADASMVFTREGEFAGSLAYAAPEQFRNEEVGPAADLYALGVSLHELATGANPFGAGDFAGVMQKHLELVPRRLSDADPNVSPFLSEVVATLLAKEAGSRFESAGALLEALTEGERSEWWREREAKLWRGAPRRRATVPVRRETKLHGREEDLAALREAYARACDGQGCTILLEGEAGIGKTRLVDAFLEQIEETDPIVLYGSYSPAGGLGGLSDAVCEHLGATHLEAALQPLLTVTPRLIPAFAALLLQAPPPEGAATLEGDALHAVFVQLMRALAADRPLVWVVDDLHFASEDSRKIALSLARAVEGHRVLLLLATRPQLPAELVAHLARFAGFQRLVLGRLSAREVILLLQDAFGSERLADKLGARIALKSDGIPFFVFEMIRGLREGQFITQLPDGSWIETQLIDRIEVPSDVRDLIGARVRGLDREGRAILDVGAVQGFVFDADLTARVLGLRRIEVLQSLAESERNSGIVCSGGDGYRFDHHQLQEVLYEALPPELRTEYHALVAEALETRAKAADKDPKTLDGALCAELCEHNLKGARSESALRYFSAAQKHLATCYQHAQVVALSERALAVPDLLTGIERANALLQLGTGALRSMGRYARQEECLREAERLAEEAGDDELLGNAVAELGECLNRTSRYTLAEEAIQRSIDLARARGDRSAEARARGHLGNVFTNEGRLDEARDCVEQRLAFVREMGDRKGEALATAQLGNLFTNEGRPRDARGQYERSLALSCATGDRACEAHATSGLGSVFSMEGRLREAREHFERSLALYREVGDRQNEAVATGNLGRTFCREGRLRDAREHLERYRVLCREVGHWAGEARAAGDLGIVLASEGRLREARKHFEQALDLCREYRLRGGEARSLINLGVLLGEEGDTALAEERLLASLVLSEEMGDRNNVVVAHHALGGLRAAARDFGGAREALSVARDLAAENLLSVWEAIARFELACLPGGDAADALAAFTEYEGQLDADGRRGGRWLLFRATGDRAHLEEAKRLLDEAVAHVDGSTKESMLTNVRLNREIMEAWANL